MRARLRSESGQVIPLTAIALMAVLLGISALVIDAGVWYTKSRHAQNVADAAALAAIQDLPMSPGTAVADATAYAATNGGTLNGPPVVSSTSSPNDTITVKAIETTPTIFAKFFGINTVSVHATASAQAAGTSFVQGGGFGNGVGKPVPFAISVSTWTADGLNKPVTLTFGPANPTGSGNFGILDFAGAGGGTPPRTVAGWITGGYPGQLGPGTYGGVPGNKYNAIKTAMATLVGKTVTMPVFSSTNGAAGANLQYAVVGWAAFVVSAVNVGGATTTLDGKFVSLHVDQSGPPTQYFGVGHVKLTK